MDHRADYVLKNFFLFYHNIKVENIIHYGDVENKDAKVIIKKSAKDDFFLNKKDLVVSKIIKKEWNGKLIPFCFDDSDLGEIISQKENKVYINYDIISSAFYFLSGWNEFVSGSKDNYGRIAFKGSMVEQLNIVGVPVVNYYFDIIKTAIEKACSTNIKTNLWGKKDFAAVLTHDIDNCTTAWIEGSFSELKKGNVFAPLKLIAGRLSGKDEWFNFDRISEIEKDHEGSSTFYFLPRKGKTGEYKNSDYDISTDGIQNVIRSLSSKGHEIGVHGSFGSHLDSDLFNDDIKRINMNDIIGNRFHFLMFDIVKTVNVLEDSPVKYDTSLGYSERAGFRRGTCFPFYLYNFDRQESSDIIEIPLIVMDATLRSCYGSNEDEKLIEEVKSLLGEVKKFNGVFTLLSHNNYFSDYKYKGWREKYIKILEILNIENALITTGKDIYERVTNN